jgi:hypothetical protein
MEKEVARCVNCRFPLDNDEQDFIDSIKDQPKPKQGDFSICIACGQPYVFVENIADPENLLRHPLTKDQFRAMPMRVQQIIKDAWMLRKDIIDQAEQMKKNRPGL